MQTKKSFLFFLYLFFYIFIFSQLCGCIASAVIGGAALVGTSAHDRRSFGQQANDESFELKAMQVIPQKYHHNSHFNITAYNSNILITGEAPNAESSDGIIAAVKTIPNIRNVYNELRIAMPSSLATRSNDSFITSKVKAKLVNTENVSTNHIKVVTENSEVFLLGLVNATEAKIVIETVRRISGVAKVINLLEIVPNVELGRHNIDAHLEDEKNRTIQNHNNYYYTDEVKDNNKSFIQ